MDDHTDPIWEAFVELILPMGTLREQPSRYGAKPAVYRNSREIAHSEGSRAYSIFGSPAPHGRRSETTSPTTRR
jgi:hypothetical protein